jgi:hypothetical protein
VASVQRFDVGRLDRAKRTGAGGARVPASVARTGVQVYTDERGNVVREYRPPEAVFAPASLETLGSIPVTVGHPAEGVNPRNYRQLSVGHVSDAPSGRRADGPLEWLDTAVVVHDADALRKVESGELAEVSMGYLADVIPEAGIAPDGQAYDAKQTNIRFNHLALLKDGHARAGSGARLRLDGHQEPIPMFVRHDDNTTPASQKLIVKVDGIDVEKGSDTHLSLLDRSITAQTKRADDATTALTAAQTLNGEQKAKLDAAELELKTLKAQDVNVLVADELAFRQSMLPVLPKVDGKPYDFTGKTREQVKADAVGPAVMAEAAKLTSDAERSGFIGAHLKIKLDAVGKAPASLHVPSVVTDSTDPTKPKKRRDARADAFNASFGAGDTKAP